jgi:hypothetical protein
MLRLIAPAASSGRADEAAAVRAAGLPEDFVELLETGGRPAAAAG